jgi:hypothetical protein
LEDPTPEEAEDRRLRNKSDRSVKRSKRINPVFRMAIAMRVAAYRSREDWRAQTWDLEARDIDDLARIIGAFAMTLREGWRNGDG